jgi:hypothetical protein
MDFYRVVVVREHVRRITDLEATTLQFAVQQAQQAGWQVSYALLPREAELLPGVLEEPVDLLLN